MSGNDAFDRAVRALRETGETPAADVARTRKRVVETVLRGERRGRRTFWVLLPIAAVLAGSTALAKNSDVARRLWTDVAETVGIAPSAEKSAPALRTAKGLVPPPPALVEEPPVRVSEPAAAVPDNAAANLAQGDDPAGAREPLRSTPSRRRRSDIADRAAVSPPTTSHPPPEMIEPEAPAAAPPNDGEAASLQLYKDAYRLHFVEQRYAAALVAWDEYMRSAPEGRLIVEARYNRAIALVRLGRRGEAEAALTPFARGQVGGGYRVREARELLDALNASSR